MAQRAAAAQQKRSAKKKRFRAGLLNAGFVFTAIQAVFENVRLPRLLSVLPKTR